MRFSEAILIIFVMLNNGKRHFVIRNAWNSEWVRLNDDSGIKRPSLGQCLLFVFGWANPASNLESPPSDFGLAF